MRVVSIVHLDFLNAHGGYCTATIYIHLHYFFAIYFNSRKTLFPVASCWKLLALLKFLSCYYWCGVVAAGGSARKERKLLLLLLREGAFVLHSSQPTKPGNSSRASRRYHQGSTTPSSSSTTPTRNSGSGYTTSTVHQSPFGGAH